MENTYYTLGMVRERDHSITIVYSVTKHGAAHEANFPSEEEMTRWCDQHNCQPPYRTCITIL